jgi:hypothetical protein
MLRGRAQVCRRTNGEPDMDDKEIIAQISALADEEQRLEKPTSVMASPTRSGRVSVRSR